MRTLAPLVAAAALVLGAGTARAQDDRPILPEAKAHYDKGVALAQKGIELVKTAGKEAQGKDLLEKAIAEYQAGYLIDPRRDYLFAWAQAERLSGDCATATTLYRKFIAQDPGQEDADAAKARIVDCEALLPKVDDKPPPKVDDRPPPKVDDKPPVDDGGRLVEPRPAGDEGGGHKAWYKDPVGDALVGAGVVGLAVGGLYWSKSSSTESDAKKPGRVYGEYKDLIEKAQSQRKIAIVGLVAGGGLVAAGVVRYILFDRGQRRHEPAVTLYYGDGVGLAVTGEF